MSITKDFEEKFVRGTYIGDREVVAFFADDLDILIAYTRALEAILKGIVSIVNEKHDGAGKYQRIVMDARLFVYQNAKLLEGVE